MTLPSYGFLIGCLKYEYEPKYETLFSIEPCVEEFCYSFILSKIKVWVGI